MTINKIVNYVKLSGWSASILDEKKCLRTVIYNTIEKKFFDRRKGEYLTEEEFRKIIKKHKKYLHMNHIGMLGVILDCYYKWEEEEQAYVDYVQELIV